MVCIFQWIIYELPPFETYWTHTFQNKSMYVVGEFHSKVFPFYRLINDLFSPEDDNNKETSSMIGKMAVTSAKALLAKIKGWKKATADHL